MNDPLVIDSGDFAGLLYSDVKTILEKLRKARKEKDPEYLAGLIKEYRKKTEAEKAKAKAEKPKKKE